MMTKVKHRDPVLGAGFCGQEARPRASPPQWQRVPSWQRHEAWQLKPSNQQRQTLMKMHLEEGLQGLWGPRQSEL